MYAKNAPIDTRCADDVFHRRERDYTEEDVARALLAVENGTSIRKAALDNNVPFSTVKSRKKGTLPATVAFESFQKLSQTQEKHLASWIIIQGAIGRPPTHAQVRAIAASIADPTGEVKTIGKHWLDAFLRRNPSIKVLRTKSIDAKRVNGASTDVISTWFHRLLIPEVRAILPQNRWNMDETGFSSGEGDVNYVLGTGKKSKVRSKFVGKRAWTSTVECISATGARCPPLIIFTGKTVQQQWFPPKIDKFKTWRFTATTNGWTDDETGLAWLRDVFLPNTTPSRPGDARLLIIDGHGSHESDEFMKICFRNNIYMLFLPPHASHVLQPLDLTIFSPLKTAFRKTLMNLTGKEEKTFVNKKAFLQAYHTARDDAITVRNIRSGWLTSGLWPVNVKRPLMSSLVVGEKDNEPSTPNNVPTRRTARLAAFSNGNLQGAGIVWSTPRKSIDLAQQLRLFQRQEGDSTTSRVLFQKVRKAYDEKVIESTLQKRKISALEATVESLRPFKKKAVQTDPNTKFATIIQIQRAQIAAGADVELLSEKP